MTGKNSSSPWTLRRLCNRPRPGRWRPPSATPRPCSPSMRRWPKTSTRNGRVRTRRTFRGSCGRDSVLLRSAPLPRPTKLESIERQGYQIEKIAMRPEAGITVPALAFVPSGGPPRKPAVIYVNAAGKSADAGEGGPIDKIVRAGNIVLAIDPRGWGEGAPPPGPRGSYSTNYQTAMRAILVGKSMAGMQTGDVLSAFDWLAARPDVDPKRIAIIGKGNGGVLALFAAALEPRIAKVAREKAPAILHGHRAGQNARRHHRDCCAGRATRFRSARCGRVAQAAIRVDRGRRKARLRGVAAALSQVQASHRGPSDCRFPFIHWMIQSCVASGRRL